MNSISSTVAPTSAQAAPSVWGRVAACESGGNWGIATGNGYYGGLQFSASSWRAAGGSRYASLPHKATKSQQIAVAQNLLRLQGPGAWPVCSRKAGLTKSNGGATNASTAVSRSKVRPAVVEHRSMTKAQVRKLQRVVGANVDGVVGPETVRKTQSYVKLDRTGESKLTGRTMTLALRLVK